MTSNKQGAELASHQVYGRWELIKQIGSGGNSNVWLAKDTRQEINYKVAIKFLKKTKSIAKKRFEHEIKIMKECHEIPGCMPIIDSYLDSNPLGQSSLLWYVMPKGQTATKKLETSRMYEIITMIFLAARALARFHQRGIAHRDVKPENIIYLEHKRQWVMADFGIADSPTKETLTRPGEMLGPGSTIAPEMRHNATNADGIKADIYSIACTLWMLLTKNKYGLVGQYDRSSANISLRNLLKPPPSGEEGAEEFAPNRDREEYRYLPQLEIILEKATSIDPNARPSMDEFADMLKEWLDTYRSFRVSTRSLWHSALERLFPVSMPSRATWTKIDDIISVLSIVGSKESLNHTFFPEFGGMDIAEIRRSAEKDCIELIDTSDGVTILKPEYLTFVSFGEQTEWSFFWIQASPLPPAQLISNVNQIVSDTSEELIEVSVGNYIEYEAGEIGYYQSKNGGNIKIPPGWREIYRYRARGAFVLACKASPYNEDSRTYDARHNKMGLKKFIDYMQRQVTLERQRYQSKFLALLYRRQATLSK